MFAAPGDDSWRSPSRHLPFAAHPGWFVYLIGISSCLPRAFLCNPKALDAVQHALMQCVSARAGNSESLLFPAVAPGDEIMRRSSPGGFGTWHPGECHK